MNNFRVEIEGVKTESLLTGKKEQLPSHVIEDLIPANVASVIENLENKLGLQIIMLDGVCTRRMVTLSIVAYIQNRIEEGYDVKIIGASDVPMTLIDSSMTFDVLFKVEK